MSAFRNVDGLGGWVRVGALRGAAIGVLTPPACALAGIVVVLTATPEPLPAGTTTTSTQTPTQAFAGVVLLGLYVAIASSIGSTVGATIGAATAAFAGALDSASGRRAPTWLLAGIATVTAGWAVQAVAIDLIPTSGPLDAGAERAWRLAFALPFLLGLLSLVLAPLTRTRAAPRPLPAAPHAR